MFHTTDKLYLFVVCDESVVVWMIGAEMPDEFQKRVYTDIGHTFMDG